MMLGYVNSKAESIALLAASISKMGGASTVAVATSGTITVDCSLGTTVTITPSNACTFNATNVGSGQRVTFVITTSGSSSFTLTFGTNFKSTGTLATGVTTAKVFTVSFVSDGTNMNEVSRTTAM